MLLSFGAPANDLFERRGVSGCDHHNFAAEIQ
jgi:hypothetical protein